MSAPVDHFTGDVTAETLAQPGGPHSLAVYTVHFAAGAHTHWHTHPLGQGLYVVSGIAFVQLEGRPAVRLLPGDHIWIDPDRRHWHGAGPEMVMTHLAYQQAAIDGTTVCWHEPVSPTTYRQAKDQH